MLQSITGNYDVVWSFNAGSGSWHSSNDDLTEIDHRLGLMIHMNAPDELVTVGEVEITTLIQLRKGWNFVGYDYHLGSTTIGDTLSGFPYSAVQRYDASDLMDKWKHNNTSKVGAWASSNDLNDMQIGNGYWIYVKGDSIWYIRNE